MDENGKVLGTLVRPHWYSSKCEMALAGGLYEVKALKRWSSDQAVFVGDVPVLVADFSWDRIRISAPNVGGASFVLRRKHFFSSAYNVLDHLGMARARVDTRINWSDLERESELVASEGEPLEPMVLLFIMHLIRVQHNRTAGMAAGA